MRTFKQSGCNFYLCANIWHAENHKQAMPQLTDRSKLPNIVDPVIRDTMDPKHLYQVLLWSPANVLYFRCSYLSSYFDCCSVLMQVAAVAVLCVQPEPSYRPLITDVLHSLVPLVPVELGGTLRVAEPPSPNLKHSPCWHVLISGSRALRSTMMTLDRCLSDNLLP